MLSWDQNIILGKERGNTFWLYFKLNAEQKWSMVNTMNSSGTNLLNRSWCFARKNLRDIFNVKLMLSMTAGEAYP